MLYTERDTLQQSLTLQQHTLQTTATLDIVGSLLHAGHREGYTATNGRPLKHAATRTAHHCNMSISRLLKMIGLFCKRVL